MPLPLALLAAAPGIIEGGVKIGQSLIGRKERMAEQLRAKNAYDSSRADYMNLDTTNPFLNQENTMEDLTVNQQQAQFQQQQQRQSQANILSSLRGFIRSSIKLLVNSVWLSIFFEILFFSKIL